MDATGAPYAKHRIRPSYCIMQFVNFKNGVLLDKPIYRFMPFPRLIELLTTKKLTLLRTDLWNDPWENQSGRRRLGSGSIEGSSAPAGRESPSPTRSGESIHPTDGDPHRLDAETPWKGAGCGTSKAP